MTEKAHYQMEIIVELPDGGGSELDKPYVALFGILDMFEQLGVSKEEKIRVLSSLANFIG